MSDKRCNFQNIPQELKKIEQWIHWKYETRKSKPTKPPVSNQGKKIDAQNPQNWHKFERAKALLAQNKKLSGIGLVLTSELGLVGIDLDDCFDKQGDVEQWAKDIVQRVASYTETSPSGNGLRIFVWGNLPVGVDGKKKGALELYQAGRYLTVTGNVYSGSQGFKVVENQRAIDEIFQQYFATKKQTSTKSSQKKKQTQSTNQHLADHEILAKAAKAKNGAKFDKLFSGDFSDYKSQSEADLGLCEILAFWTNNDSEKIDQLFRNSGLYRPKWDEQRGSETYGQMTIAKAIHHTRGGYNPAYYGQGASETELKEQEYFEGSDGLYWNKPLQHGVVPTRLTNFYAKIIEETVRDDGAEKSLHFQIEAKLCDRTYTLGLSATEFSKMQWPTEALGGQAIVEPGQLIRDRARCAIQTLSENFPRKEVFLHTGWQQTSSGWAFLSVEGALGSKGLAFAVETDLKHLSNYTLLTPPPDEALQQAFLETYNFFSNLPPKIGIPLILAPFRAILAEATPPDVSIHLAGMTGCFKSEMAAIVQSFFGQALADKRNIPAGWSSTTNFLEYLAFLAKDAILVVDDFAPTGTSSDIARLQRDAERLFRAAGNQSGRGRMNADGSLRPTYYPRGLVLSTGEDVPPGQSLRARLLIIELKRGDISSELLSKGQDLASGGAFNELAAGFIQWCASQMDYLKKDFPQKCADLRKSLRITGHARLCDNVAHFLATAELLGDFAKKIKALDSKQRENFITLCTEGL